MLDDLKVVKYDDDLQVVLDVAFALGKDGKDGAGVPPAGSLGQVLAKKSEVDFDTQWINQVGTGSPLESFPPVTVPDTSYILAHSDHNHILNCVAKCTITVPIGIILPFTVDIAQGGSEQVTISPDVGVVINEPDNLFSTEKQYVRLTLTEFSENTFLLSGRTATSGPPDPDPILEAPVNIQLPVIFGDPGITGLLVVSDGVWENNPDYFEYQWLADGVEIIGETSFIYSLSADDIGIVISAAVTAFNETGDTSATALGVGPISGIAPVNTATPVILGGSTPPFTGETLTAFEGSWTGTPLPTYTYQWKADSVNIPDAIERNYLLTVSEENNLITVTVTATNISGSVSATTASVGPVVLSVDVTGPTLSLLTVTSLSNSTATFEVTTSEGGGLLYLVVVPVSAAAPSAEQIRAGTDASNNPAIWAGSIEVAGITTYGPTIIEPLGAGDTLKAYAVHYDNEDNPSNVISDEFTQSGGVIPILTSFAISDQNDISARLTAYTDTGNGHFYAVIVPVGATPPDVTQIEAGTDGSGNLATASAEITITHAGINSIELFGLTSATTYDVYMFHEAAAGGDSIIQTAEFTTDTFVRSGATDGLTTNFSSPTGVLSPSQPDSEGGINAIAVTDIPLDPVVAAGFSLNFSVPAFVEGVTRFRFRFKVISSSGAFWARITTVNISAGTGLDHINLVTGTIGVGTQAWLTEQIYPSGNGFFEFVGTGNIAGPDLNGAFQMTFGDAENDTALLRDGTHTLAIHNFRITKVN